VGSTTTTGAGNATAAWALLTSIEGGSALVWEQRVGSLGDEAIDVIDGGRSSRQRCGASSERQTESVDSATSLAPTKRERKASTREAAEESEGGAPIEEEERLERRSSMARCLRWPSPVATFGFTGVEGGE